MARTDYGLAGHKLKSPIVSIKALTFLLRRQVRGKNKEINENILKIEEKADVLNKRVNQFISFLEYQEKDVKFLYEIFQVNEIFKKIKLPDKMLELKKVKQKIIADKQKIMFALDAFLKVFKSVKNIEVAKVNKSLGIKIYGEVDKNSFDEKKIFDETDDRAINFYVSKKIIKLHGGSLKIGKNTMIINIPLKPAPKK